MKKTSEAEKKWNRSQLAKRKLRAFIMILFVLLIAPLAVIAGIYLLLAGQKPKGLAFIIIPILGGIFTIYMSIKELLVIKAERAELLKKGKI